MSISENTFHCCTLINYVKEVFNFIYINNLSLVKSFIISTHILSFKL